VANRIEPKQVTIPAGTAIATPATTNLTFNRGNVIRIEIKVPPGPSGLMGFMIGHSGGIVIPYDGSTWLVLDDDNLDWPVVGFPTGSAWFLRGYNTGLYTHTVYLRFHIDELSRAISAPVGIVPIGPVMMQEVPGG
jgi:hypothetical protein